MLFFEADAVAVEKPPNRPNSRFLLPLIAQAALNLFQRQIGFTPDQLEQPFLVLLQWRLALTPFVFGFVAASLSPALRPPDRG
jgi:hypothetical protein